MGAGVIKRVVELAIGLAGLAMVIALARAAALVLSGSSAPAVWPVTTDSPATQALSGGASVAWTHGSLAIANQPLVQWSDLLSQVITLGLAIWALLALRQLLVRFAQGQFLVSENVLGLRRIAAALLLSCVLSLAGAMLLQPLLLGQVESPVNVVMHPSLSWSVAGKTNIWLDYELPIGTALLAGLALLFAEALKSGIAYREDSEGVL